MVTSEKRRTEQLLREYSGHLATATSRAGLQDRLITEFENSNCMKNNQALAMTHLQVLQHFSVDLDKGLTTRGAEQVNRYLCAHLQPITTSAACELIQKRFIYNFGQSLAGERGAWNQCLTNRERCGLQACKFEIHGKVLLAPAFQAVVYQKSSQ